MRRVTLLLTATALALTAACGSAPLEPSTAALLQQRVSALRAAVAADDANAVTMNVTALRDAVAAGRSAGSVSEQRATDLLAAAGSLAADFTAAHAAAQAAAQAAEVAAAQAAAAEQARTDAEQAAARQAAETTGDAEKGQGKGKKGD